mmetsp:Transcript_8310/g.12704  ORF Transcript_8310/g.12704 Transcript_8310/m.12704 type:complete len:80 (+) Transcript_8310:353-592(+)
MYVSADGYPYFKSKQGRKFFFFYVTDLPETPQVLTFNIKSLGKLSVLFKLGHKPVFIVVSKSHGEKLAKGQAPFYREEW